jgi:sugar/nucleoside kinase (ribokinase family)
MLSAMSKPVRARSTYVSTLAHNEAIMDPFSAFFSAEVRKLGLVSRARTVPGHNPAGFVLYEPADPDRVLATYPGVSTEVHLPDQVDEADLVLIDTYELLTGPLSRQLHDLISSGRARIGLSLGNARILTGDIRRRLRGHIDAGRVSMIFGSASEYRMLYPDLPPDLATPSGFLRHPIRHRVPFCLLTDGTNGMAAHHGPDYAAAPAAQVEAHEVINTSGAGDTAAGVFVVGVLSHVELANLLRQCAEQASRVVSIPGSRIVG